MPHLRTAIKIIFTIKSITICCKMFECNLSHRYYAHRFSQLQLHFDLTVGSGLALQMTKRSLPILNTTKQFAFNFEYFRISLLIAWNSSPKDRKVRWADRWSRKRREKLCCIVQHQIYHLPLLLECRKSGKFWCPRSAKILRQLFQGEMQHSPFEFARAVDQRFLSWSKIFKGMVIL